MITTTEYPIRVRMSAKAMSELENCEYGSYEDHIHSDGTREEPYDDGSLHIVELIQRSPSKSYVDLQDQREVDEFFGQACTGTFGLYHPRICLRIYDELRPHASEKVAEAVSRYSIGY